jgi:predicted glutamine amidotransferase
MRKLGPINFLYTDGDVLFAHGDRRTQLNGTIAPPGLWCLSRRCINEPDELSQAGIVIEPKEQAQEVLLFASVPLTDEHWRPLIEGEVVAAKNGCVLSAVPVSSKIDRIKADPRSA